MPFQRYIVAADARRAILYDCRHVPGSADARLHVEAVSTLENKEQVREKYQLGRPSTLGRGPSASAVQHYAPLGHLEEEALRRFAREVVAWLKGAGDRPKPPRLTLFAAPRFLGAIRGELDRSSLAADLREGELTHLRPNEIAVHPAVRALVEED